MSCPYSPTFSPAAARASSSQTRRMPHWALSRDSTFSKLSSTSAAPLLRSRRCGEVRKGQSADGGQERSHSRRCGERSGEVGDMLETPRKIAVLTEKAGNIKLHVK